MQVNWKWALALAAVLILGFVAWKKFQEKKAETPAEKQEG